jgi:CheY-like chemotaxis protein
MRILVVEDEPLLADTVAQGLRQAAHAVDVVYDGSAALERIDVNDYDVVVLDRDLPGVHGDDVCRALVERYDGDAANLWADVDSGAELVRRVASLPGFGKQKSQIFAALLGKQFGVRPDGWREAAGHYGEEGSYRSVADIVDQGSLEKVRAYKKEMKAAAKA